MIDSSVLPNDIIHPNDVLLVYKAFKKMAQFAKLHGILVWWDENELKKLWREYLLMKKANRLEWLIKFNALFIPAFNTFKMEVQALNIPQSTEKRKSKAETLCRLLLLILATEAGIILKSQRISPMFFWDVEMMSVKKKRTFVVKQDQQQKVSSQLQKISEVLGAAFTKVLREIGYGLFFVKPLII